MLAKNWLNSSWKLNIHALKFNFHEAKKYEGGVNWVSDPNVEILQCFMLKLEPVLNCKNAQVGEHCSFHNS